MPLWASILVGLGLALMGAVVDWVTDPRAASAMFYLPAIIWMAWRGGRSLGISTAAVCAANSIAQLVVAPRQYANPGILFWNGLVRMTMYCLVAGLASEVFQRKRVEKRLQIAYEDLQKLGRQVAEASDREQRSLGQDLHDGLCQHLVSTAFAARGLAAKLTDRSLPEAEDASEIAELLGASISQARDVARGLCLVPLEAGGLASALDELATHVCSHHQINCQFIEKAPVQALEETVGANLFRIAQEAVNNAIKHSQARRITITLSADPVQMRLDIEDNGEGFQQCGDSARGLGLHIMNYRARMIGAALTIASPPGGGTQVTCLLRRSNLKAPVADSHGERT
jgi:signal transduction histidine kinase